LRWIRAPFAPHGEYSNAIAELYFFSRRRWKRVFQQAGLEILHSDGNGLFYTGYRLIPRLPLHIRRLLARLLGHSSHVFVLRKGSR
jgi:hypothetical protein